MSEIIDLTNRVGGNMFARSFVSLGVILATVFPAFGAGKDKAYLCVTEAAGGMYFDESKKRWEGTVFQPDGKFVLRMKFVSEGKNFTRYEVKASRLGSNNVKDAKYAEWDCFPRMGSGPYVEDWGGTFTCHVLRDTYYFNVSNNRLLKFSEGGYLGYPGDDKNHDTPAVSAGTCAKID